MKSTTCISLDTDAFLLCKSKGFSISKICNDAVVIASGQSIDTVLNKTVQAQQNAINQLIALKELQIKAVTELQAKRKLALDEFLSDSISDSIILPDMESGLKEWSAKTGISLEELRNAKRNEINKKQHHRVIFPTIDKEEVIKELKKQGLKSDVI